jgi:Flp pilus assembly protein TadG
MAHRSPHTPHRASERGGALIEFVLAFGVFLMTLFGAFELGLAVWQFNLTSNLAQEGARWASVRGQGSGAMAASETQVQTFVRNRSLGMNPTVSTFSVNAATRECTSTHTNPSTLPAGSGLCVNVQKTFTPFTRLIPVGTLTLQSTAQMIVAR